MKSLFIALALALLLPTHAFTQDRAVYNDGDTQAVGSDHVGPLGPSFFRDRTDIYTGATKFVALDVSLPGNSRLPVALHRSLQAYDDGMAQFPSALPSWSNFEVPYLSGLYKRGNDADSGWRGTTGLGTTLLRCSNGAPPEVSQSAGKVDTWGPGEYFHGNHLYMPGGSQEPLLAISSTDLLNPTTGGPYHWVTKNDWQFSCLSSTANGVGGEGFLGVAPNGDKYYFNWLVRWRDLITLWKESFIGGPTTLSRSEYRLLVTRIEDRFGNWVNYGYSDKNLVSISSNDGRQLTLTYDTAGTRVVSVTDGTRTWTYAYNNGVQVTYPDGTVWSSTISGPGISRQDANNCNSEAIRYSGEYTVTIQDRTGAAGAFTFRPLRRGLSYVSKYSATSCPTPSKYVDGVALYSKAISGPGLTPSSWSITYGPANACYSGGVSECSAGSPTTRYVDVQGPNSTFSRYTFGNKRNDSDGMLISVQSGTSSTNILRDEQLTWNTVDPRGFASDNSYLSDIKRLLSGRTISQDGAIFSTTLSNWDEYHYPRTIVETGPNSGSRTTQLTYYHNKAAWVIGQLATSMAPGQSLASTFYPNGSLQSVTSNGVSSSVTYHSDGNIASIAYPPGLTNSYSNYKRGIPQTEVQPEGITKTRLVNDHGYITSETNGEGQTTAYGYDVMGRVNAIDLPLGNDISLVHLPLSTTITRGALAAVNTYDGLRRLTRSVTGGIATEFEYDAYSRRTFSTNPGEMIGTRVEYDVLGRPKKVTNADATFSTYAYGAGTVTTTDERSRGTTYSYRGYGTPAKQLLLGIATPEAAANISIVRKPSGLIESVTQGGVTRSYQYDARNYLESETNPETGMTSFVRDDAGNMLFRTVAGLQTAYTYDGQRRLKTITYPDSTPAVTYSYDKNNQLRSVVSSVATRVLDYDYNGNLRGESLTIDGVTLHAGYGVDANDNFSSITYPVSGRMVTYTPDALGRPTQISGYVSSVTYWDSGLPRDITYGNGVVTHYEKNARLWTSEFHTRRGSTYYIRSSYFYDAVGNLSTLVDSAEPTMNRSLGYDGIDRLTSASGPWGSGAITYDGAGNIRTQNLGSFALAYSYDPQNRLQGVSGSRNESFTYDGQGNVTALGGSTFVYNAAPTLACALCSSAQPISYAYDGVNRRVKATKAGVSTYEFYSLTGKLLATYKPSAQNSLVEYIYLGDQRIAQRASDDKPATSLAMRSSAISTSAGSTTLTVAVGGASPGGTVTFSEGGAILGTAYVIDGQASIDVLGLTLGTHTITITYSGDFANSGNTVTVQVRVINLDWLPAVLDLVLN